MARQELEHRSGCSLGAAGLGRSWPPARGRARPSRARQPRGARSSRRAAVLARPTRGCARPLARPRSPRRPPATSAQLQLRGVADGATVAS
eukprot:10391094-Alexandrium_andersonii.AAC.1